MNSTKITVSLVDDHAVLRNGLAAVINDLPNYQVISQSSNGKDFVAIVEQKKIAPQVVLLDVSMPYMDGFETAAWITANLPHTKILVLSMFNDERSIIKMIRKGAKGYILKESEPHQLEIALNELVNIGYHYSEIVNGKLIYAVNKHDVEDTEPEPKKLTGKEIEFLKHSCTELTYKDIAKLMFLSVRTVESYRDILFAKLEIKSRIGLVLYAIKNKIVEV